MICVYRQYCEIKVVTLHCILYEMSLILLHMHVFWFSIFEIQKYQSFPVIISFQIHEPVILILLQQLQGSALRLLIRCYWLRVQLQLMLLLLKLLQCQPYKLCERCHKSHDNFHFDHFAKWSICNLKQITYFFKSLFGCLPLFE